MKKTHCSFIERSVFLKCAGAEVTKRTHLSVFVIALDIFFKVRRRLKNLNSGKFNCHFVLISEEIVSLNWLS